MSYYFNKTLDASFEDAVERVKAELKKEGFGVLTDIDVRKTLQEKIGVDFRPYRILGACNPLFAYKALVAEDKIGTMLPCNVIVQELAAKGIIVRGAGRATIDEEISEAYKDVADVVDACALAGISNKVVQLKPLGCIKG